MIGKAVILENSKRFKRGRIVEKYVPTTEGIITEDGDFIEKGKVILLTEKLSSKDEDEVRKLIREFMRTFLWRLYTRNAFLVK